MKFSSIFYKIKAAISPQSAPDTVKPEITVTQAPAEEFQVVAQPQSTEMQAVSASKEKPKIAARKSKPEKPQKPKGKPGRPRKIQPHPVEEKKESEPKKETLGESPANQPLIDKSLVINPEQPKEISTVQQLVESANGSISENGGISPKTGITPSSDKPWLWKPGMSGNPSGRPKSRLISEELKDLLAAEDDGTRTGAERLGRKAMALAEQDKDGYLSLAAIKEITDRVEGKPVQTSNVRGIMVMMPAESVLSSAFESPDPDN